MLPAILAVWFPLVAAAPTTSLTAVAASSSRPKECVVSERTGKPTFWRKARFPQQGPYCDAVAKAHIQLIEDPSKALETAERAALLWPGKPGALVAKARALVELGRDAEALAIFEAVNEAVPSTFDEPRALASFARALAREGELGRAEPFFRKLVPRVSFFSAAERARILLEAAFVLTAVDEANPDLPSKIEDARAFVDEARELADGSVDVAFAHAWLALRAGDLTSFEAALRGLRDSLSEAPVAPSYLLAPADEKGFAALALEARGGQAAEAWAAAGTTTQRRPLADLCAAQAKPASKQGKAGKAPPRARER